MSNDDDDDEFTIDEAIDSTGFGLYQWKVTFLCGCFWAADAFQVMLLSFLLKEVKVAFPGYNPDLIAATSFAGIAVGSWFAGLLADRVGRRPVYGASALLTGLLGVGASFAPSFESLLVLQLLNGLVLGGAPVAYALYSEFLPTASRARALVLFNLFWTLGTIGESLLALAVLKPLGWRWLLRLSAVPILLLAASVFVLEESPRFQLVSGRTHLALRTLQRIAKTNGGRLPTRGRLVAVKRRGELTGEPTAPPSSQQPLGGVRQALLDDGGSDRPGKRAYGAADGADGGGDGGGFAIDRPSSPMTRKPARVLGATSVRHLFGSQFGALTGLLCVIWANNSFTYYGLVLYTVPFFEAVTGNQNTVVNTLITTLAELPGVLFVVLFVNRLGRRRVMTGTLYVCAVATLCLLVPLNAGRDTISETTRNVLGVGLAVVSRAAILAAYVTVYLYTPEAYPTAIRGIGLGFAAASAKLASIVTPFVAGLSSSVAPICIYAAFAAVAAVAAARLPFETTGAVLKDTV